MSTTHNYKWLGAAMVIALGFVLGLIIIPDVIRKVPITGAGPTTSTTSSTAPPTTPTTSTPPPTTPTTSTPPPTTPTTEPPTTTTTSSPTYSPSSTSTVTSQALTTRADGKVLNEDGLIVNDSAGTDTVVNPAAGINGSIESAKVDEAAVAQQAGPSFCGNNMQCIENVLRALCVECSEKGWPAGPDDPLAIFDVKVTFDPVDNNTDDIVIAWRTNKPSSSQVTYEIATTHKDNGYINKTARITSLSTYHRVVVNNQPVNQNYLFQIFSETKEEKTNTDFLAAQSPRDYDSIWELILKTAGAYF